ncbi:hypothetical protein [Streptomyces chartreusis]|uniref:hypothetical protein n=1 Tax=Streptomyces chartreusis TaxID=1969 RepID=UPI0036439664
MTHLIPGEHGATRQCAESQIRALNAHDVPEYGTREWLDLDPEDPRRYAATLEAAELWRRHCLLEQLRRMIRDNTGSLTTDGPSLRPWPGDWPSADGPPRLLKDTSAQRPRTDS